MYITMNGDLVELNSVINYNIQKNIVTSRITIDNSTKVLYK